MSQHRTYPNNRAGREKRRVDEAEIRADRLDAIKICKAAGIAVSVADARDAEEAETKKKRKADEDIPATAPKDADVVVPGDGPSAYELLLRDCNTLLLSRMRSAEAEAIRRVGTDRDALYDKEREARDHIEAIERELAFRELEDLRLKINRVKPGRAVLTKLVSLLRTYCNVIDIGTTVEGVTYLASSVAFSVDSRHCLTQYELRPEGDVMRGGVRVCNIMTDNPREWKL